MGGYCGRSGRGGFWALGGCGGGVCVFAFLGFGLGGEGEVGGLVGRVPLLLWLGC